MTRSAIRLGLLALAVSAVPALAQLSGSGVLTSVALPSGQYLDTIVIQNTGTTTIGTFWLAWIPGEDFLPSAPTNVTAPAGWYAYVEPGFASTYSIQFYAYTPDFYLPAGQSLSGFGFQSADSPTTLQALSTPFPRYHVTDSFLYEGPAEYDPGYQFNVSVVVGTPGGGCGTADFNCDGDIGTDSDIAAFFACLSGSCPAAPCTNNADFNGDGDTGTDSDIEAFFRVLSGGAC